MTGFNLLGDADHPWLSGGRGLLFAIAITVLAALLQIMLAPVTRPFPLLFYFPAIGLAALYGGTFAGFLSALISGLCIFRFAWPGPHAPLAAAVVIPPFVAYAAVVAGIILVSHAIRVAFLRLRARYGDAIVQVSLEKEKIGSLRHRMTSNMQVVASLLTLQKLKLRPDPTSAAQMLDDVRQRVVNMSRINRRLDERESTASGMREYLQSLCSDFQSSATAHQIVCSASDDLNINEPEKLMALSMLLGEAVGNAIKHAFDDNQTGTVTINLRRTSPIRYQLIVKDNGRGLAPHIDPSACGSSGFLIMQAMAVQLGGKLEMSPSVQGTTLIVQFEL